MTVFKKRAVPAAERAFPPRSQPRDRHDWRMVIVICGLIAPLIGVFDLLFIATQFAIYFGLPWLGVPFPAALLMFLLLSLLMVAGTVRVFFFPTVWMLTVTDGGLHLRGVAGAETIGWDAIESVEPLNRGETLGAMLRYPFREWKLKGSSGMTFGGYVRIRHRNGTLLYAPENRSELLNALHTHLYRQNPCVEIPVSQFHEVVAQKTEADMEQLQLGRQ